MNTYRNEVLYACGLSVGLTGCCVAIITEHNNIALLMLLISSIFILLEFYSLFLRIDGDGRVSSATAHLKPDPYSMPADYDYDDIESVSEPIIIKKDSERKDGKS